MDQQQEQLMQQQQQQPQAPTLFQQSSHPTVLFFHLFFRSVAVLLYILGGFFSSFVLFFILIVLLLAMDFWTVKNVSGRKLVGLRWWNEIRPDGSSHWVFESRLAQPGNAPSAPATAVVANPVDRNVFWYSLYLTSALWILFAVIAVLRLQFAWLVVVGVAISLNSANLIGYTKCEKDAKKKMQSLMARGIMGNLMGGGGGMLSGLFGK